MTEVELIAIIEKIDTAIEAAITGQSYTLDTGQSRQTVNRQDLGKLKDLRDDYQDELDDLTNPGGGILKVNNLPYR